MCDRMFHSFIFLTMTIILAAQVLGRVPQKVFREQSTDDIKTTTEFPDVIVEPIYEIAIETKEHWKPMRFGK